MATPRSPRHAMLVTVCNTPPQLRSSPSRKWFRIVLCGSGLAVGTWPMRDSTQPPQAPRQFATSRRDQCRRLPLSATVAPVTPQQVDAATGLPPLAAPDANEDERAQAIVARMVARYGAPTIEDYRRVYEQSGVPWPGDEEIRRRHPVASAA
jgi:hypothetical protein